MLPTYAEWYDSVCGHASAHGDQDAAKLVMQDFQNLNTERALHLYKRANAWTSRVPFLLMQTALSGFASGITRLFELVFVKEDTHVTVKGLESLMKGIERDKPWLHWVDLVDWSSLQKQGTDTLVNPKFLQDIYKFDSKVRDEYNKRFIMPRNR